MHVSRALCAKGHGHRLLKLLLGTLPELFDSHQDVGVIHVRVGPAGESFNVGPQRDGKPLRLPERLHGRA